MKEKRSEIMNCLICGKEFKRMFSRPDKKLCSRKCAAEWNRQRNPIKYIDMKCKNCGKEFKADNSQVKLGYYKFCSNRCKYEYTRGARSHNYKGGWIRPDGYKQISINGKKKLEHRAIMEKQLNRELAPHEITHHLDGNKTNNHIENLKLLNADIHSRLHSTGRIQGQKAINKLKAFSKNRKRNSTGTFKEQMAV